MRSVVASDTGQYVSESSFKGVVSASLADPSSDGTADLVLILNEGGKDVISMHLDLCLRSTTSEGTVALHLEAMRPSRLSCPPPSTPKVPSTPPQANCVFKELTPAEVQLVNDTLLFRPGSDSEILADFCNIPVTRYDMRTLLPGVWLNDEVRRAATTHQPVTRAWPARPAEPP
jgi:Ulp1 family protease